MGKFFWFKRDSREGEWLSDFQGSPGSDSKRGRGEENGRMCVFKSGG